MVEPFMIVGGTIFWIVAAIFSVALLGCIEYQKGWWSSFLVAGFFTILYFASGINVISVVLANPMTAIYYVGLYVAGGVVWGCVKWWFYSRKAVDVVKELKVKFLNEKKISGDTIPETSMDSFISSVLHSSRYHDEDYPPRFMKHKADWTMWATYWPLSFFWTMLNQPIKKLWNFVYSQVGQMMQNMTNRMSEKI